MNFKGITCGERFYDGRLDTFST